MTKIVINACYGGYSLSEKAMLLLIKKGHLEAKEYYEELQPHKKKNGWDINYHFLSDEQRANPLLVEVVEELGSGAASGSYANLKVVEIPDDVLWHIEEYDGAEHVAENHRTWD